ncbi:zinc-dependent peptidase [Wenzhouxiangella sp. XN79A]|uniref:M90 family metallopeptidase n=1 Tax=Wenzhouxiangella sp. XN79A TaxID=2724193 RepID=UPI00144A9C53|nr:M90 family metallopeptidase [Wenzhouxiangella sp. XN79A]NKI35957.1 zinc-dependent peptidase [Wenzhouxiangella sp. XN79A]
MLGRLLRRRRAREAAALAPTPDELAAVVAAWPCLQRLDARQRERLRELSGHILAGFEFHGAGGLEPDRADCLPVAVHAALPVLNRGLDWYRDFRTFILYADEFEVELEETDEDGLVHRGRDLRAGEAWELGPVVLSLADVAESGQGLGFHVVVHELAHQIDRLSGDIDGAPPLPRGLAHADWVRTLTGAWDRLNADLEAGREPFLDPYAAESPAEFFAVACEAFFDVPAGLRAEEPELYRVLSHLFDQDPAVH